MSEFMILNEAELFCSDLEFKVSHDSITRQMVRDGTRDNKNARMGCDERLSEIVKLYKNVKLTELVKKVEVEEKVNPKDA